MSGWIGVDLDGTLAKYDGWQGEMHIGEPILIESDGELTNAGCDQIASIARASIEAFLETKLNVVLSKVAA